MSGFVRLAEGILFWQVQETGSRVSEGIFTEAVFLGISVLVGMGLFLLYDIFRIFRRIVPHGAIWIGVEDFCYWLLCTAAVFLMLYQENDGMIRGFAIENNGLKEAANDLQKGIIAFSPLAQGLLTNRYLDGIPADSRIATDGRFLKESALTPEKLAQIQALNVLAGERGQTLAEMALSWILKDDKVTSVLIGASKPEQILDNIKIIGHTDFTEEELQKIETIVQD